MANGEAEWFSKRWYDYTGLSVEKSLGENWRNAFHPDDITSAGQRWRHSLDTGEEYMTEYRCKRFDGAWRWMLGRALPLRDAKTGKITKWFGTCTDIHDLVEARQEAKRTREQLSNVIKHAHVTVWTVDRNRILTFLEGKLMWDEDSDCEEASVGKNVFGVFGRHKGKEHVPLYKEPIDRILDGKDSERISEHYIDGNKRWFRTRFVPMLGTQGPSGGSATTNIEGVIGVSIDVTELKEREAELQSREKENLRLHAAEIAAKEASRLKSQFLANMSHEIRTPIAGVIGMSELLMDTELDEDQRECAENIQRSANGLLTVINDILDLSKVESGRLDIEEVQFSLSVVIRDVSKMLSFAAERKHLAFESSIQLGSPHDLIVMGDPGRVRQILTNLLTNSIKFTSRGSVMLEAAIKEETNDTVEVVFTVEDTGIGVEEEVRQRLFKPFSQADSSTARRFGGTGLGLTICKNVSILVQRNYYGAERKQLVDLMHGQITLDSTIGVGTRATFSIPFRKPQFRGGASPLVHLESLPSRLQSEPSLSSCASDHDHGSVTPPQISSSMTGKGKSVIKHRMPSSKLDFLSESSYSEGPLALERGKVHVLVVEDKYVTSLPRVYTMLMGIARSISKLR
jgi:PAS domain S-box-containing protein